MDKTFEPAILGGGYVFQVWQHQTRSLGVLIKFLEIHAYADFAVLPLDRRTVVGGCRYFPDYAVSLHSVKFLLHFGLQRKGDTPGCVEAVGFRVLLQDQLHRLCLEKSRRAENVSCR